VDLVVKVERIGASGLDLADHLDPRELEHSLNSNGDTGLTTPGGGDVDLHLERIDAAVRIRGRIDATAVATCSRCLGPAQVPLASDVDVTLFPARPEDDVAGKAAAGTADDDPQADLDDSGAMSGTYLDGQIDLAVILREVLLLGLPIQFVCRDNCAGLCDQCGANLNLGPCGCVHEHVDLRWEGLKSIKVP
jgi:uncharacterized protein